MYCKDCKYSSPHEYAKYNPPVGRYYLFCNNAKLVEECYMDRGKWTDDMLLISSDDGAGFSVGPMFGCVHFQKREA